MGTKSEYIAKINKIPTISFNKEQKEIAKKIIESTDEKDLDAVYGLITQRVKTGFVFDEAPEVNHNCVALVKENKKLNIVGDGLNPIEHKLIIGENYDALKNLCATYIDRNGKGLIDVIYIDPPYNTEATKKDGNDYKEEVEATKFIYRDKFTRDGWLNMMNERLKFAKRLLSDKGVIFISIDDSEQAYLKVLCDDVFGENNFVAVLPTIMNLKGNQDQFGFAGTHEYTLVYAKNKASAKFGEFEIDDEDLDEWEEDSIGYFKQGATLKRTGNDAPREKRPYGYYPILVDEQNIIHSVLEEEYNSIYSKETKTFNDFLVTEIVKKYEKQGYKVILPIIDKQKMSWRWSYKKVKNENYNIIAIKSDTGVSLYKKQRPDLNDLPSKKPKSIFYKPEYSTTTGTNTLKNILGGKKFDNPKPVELIKDLIYIGGSKYAIILDFFAGTGTTGQAVMELNEEDGGQRQFILVTNNENNIGTDITRERLYRVIKGKGSKGEKFKWTYTTEKPYLSANNVTVFDIEQTNLTLKDLEKAEKIRDFAKVEFKKLNPNCSLNNDFDVYNELAALNPQKGDK